jgi:hypothetical protein
MLPCKEEDFCLKWKIRVFLSWESDKHMSASDLLPTPTVNKKKDSI